MPYSHITIDERDFLQSAYILGLEISIIARILGKHISSIYREIKRNSTNGFYIASHAEEQASNRRIETKSQPKRNNKVLTNDILHIH